MITSDECILYKEFVDKYQSYLYPLMGANISKYYNPMNEVILDMGTGPGYLSIQLANRTGARIHAVDINPAMHSIAKDEADKAGLAENISFDINDVHNLSYDDNYADLIVSYSCLHHWEDVAQGLRECYRVLKPKGKIVILDTLPVDKSHLKNMKRNIKEDEYFRFVQEAFDESYTFEEIEQFLEQAEITEYTLEPFKFTPEDFIEAMDELEDQESLWVGDQDKEETPSVTWILTITK
ncbi:class I SAM-dependent methyltransferase [Halobacillus trueperi]|uniref:Methyltransferase domain-containing protein n=1 Tax=Halobacillus trueperi TaxID=156205 RepID=A0A3E0J5F1_9BACI|nr:class I SAM-dependent methyltransferase [Halobacillus trueperi]REJ07944.1 methyltransferase domain-containing protein [Halobacillus trueperi]